MNNTSSTSAEGEVGSVRVPGKAGEKLLPESTDLTPVRLTGDSSKLVLVDDDGNEFSVPIGIRLRSVLDGVDPAEPAQAERPQRPPRPQTASQNGNQTPTRPVTAEKVKKMESALRPRDIQHRIRAGEDPESVAEVAGLPVDRIMNYAAPVLAEREHVARTAQAASVRRKSDQPVSQARTLEAAVAERLAAVGIDPEQPDSIEWDAWRRPDGRWTLVGRYSDGEDRKATFVLDVAGKFVVAEDDEARWLVGDGRFTAGTRIEENPLGDDAIELVSDRDVDAAVAPVGDATWIADLDERRRPPRPVSRPVAPEADDFDDLGEVSDFGGSEAEAEPPAEVVAVEEVSAREPLHENDLPLELPFETPAPAEDLEVDPASPVEDDSVHLSAVPDEPMAEDPAPAVPKRAPKNKRGRASVPSWDEIMFGSPEE